MKLVLVSCLVYFSLLVTLQTVAARRPHLQIPFKEDHDSKFIFNLEQFDDDKLLDCTGEIYVRNHTDILIFNFRNLKILRHVNLKISKVKAAASLPVLMTVGDRKIDDPNDYDDWDWIDPRFIAKIMKYTNVDKFGRVLEESWEVSDLECPPFVNNTAVYDDYLRMELNYDLQDCIDPEEDEIVESHYRIIKFSIDQATNLITRIEYHYEKTNNELNRQNSAEIVFIGFDKY